MAPRECSSEDGRHSWTADRGRWTGEPLYGCSECRAVVIVFGDDDDEQYLTDVLGGRVVP